MIWKCSESNCLPCEGVFFGSWRKIVFDLKIGKLNLLNVYTQINHTLIIEHFYHTNYFTVTEYKYIPTLHRTFFEGMMRKG